MAGYSLNRLGHVTIVSRSDEYQVVFALWNIRTTHLVAILSYLREVTEANAHCETYQDLLAQLAITVELYRG